MALAMLHRRVVAIGGSRICRPLLSRHPKLISGAEVFPAARAVAAHAGPKGKQPPPPPPPPAPKGKQSRAPAPVEPEILDDEDEGEFDEFDGLEELNAAAQRRVLAMKEVQKKYDELNKSYLKELAQLQAAYQAKYAPIYDERKDIYLGKTKVDKFDVEDDGEEDTGVEDFWLNAMSNNDKVGAYITERDAEVLGHLVDVRSEVLVGEERGFKILFHFRENPFFTNKVLEKVYVLEPEEDVVPKQFTGTKIDWKSPSANVTLEEQKVRVKAPKGEKGAKSAFTTQMVPVDSFFTFFDPPKVPTAAEAEAMNEQDLEEVEEELSADFEMGFALKDNVIPRAVEWFTGELAGPPDEDYDDEFDEGEY